MCSPLAHQTLPLIPTLRPCDERGCAAAHGQCKWALGSAGRREPCAFRLVGSLPRARSQSRTMSRKQTAENHSGFWSSQPPAYMALLSVCRDPAGTRSRWKYLQPTAKRLPVSSVPDQGTFSAGLTSVPVPFSNGVCLYRPRSPPSRSPISSRAWRGR
jgi:hypothetical protein